MEGRGHHISLPHQHGIIISLGQYFYARSNFLDARSANENHLQRFAAQSRGSFDDDGIDLAAVGVTANRHVDRIQAGLMRILHFSGQHNRPGARAECWLAVDEVG